MRLEIGMSQFNNTLDRWSKSDKKIARELFELAKKRDYEGVTTVNGNYCTAGIKK